MIVLLFICVSTVIRTGVFGQENCVDEIETFFQCKDAAKESYKEEYETRQLLVNQCFTSNNCNNPDTVWQRHAAVHECLVEIKKTVKNTCEEQVRPGITLPEPGRHGPWPHYGYGHGRGHRGRGYCSGQKCRSRMIAQMCPDTNNTTAVATCIDRVNRETRRQVKQEARGAFMTCHDAFSPTCTAVLDDIMAKMCNCSQKQLSQPEREVAIQQCIDLDTSGQFRNSWGPKLHMFCHHGYGRNGRFGPGRQGRGRGQPGQGWIGQTNMGTFGGGRRRHGHGHGRGHGRHCD